MLGPIFSIEMLTSSRRTRQFVVRALYGFVLLIAFWFAYETAGYGTTKNLAQTANVASNFFQQFAWLQLLAVVMVGPALAAGTIATERERRTIEYLFATDLTNREIVLGKLAAQLIQLGYVLLAGVPVLALVMLMGGVAPEQLVAVFLIAVSTLITVTVLAVAVSVWSPRVRDAITRVYLILFAVLVLPGIIIQPMLSALSLYEWIGPLNDFLLFVNPFYAVANATWAGLWTAGRGGTNVDWWPVWNLVATQAVVTVALAGLATWAVRRVHLRESGKAPTKVKRFVIVRRRAGPGSHPMIWKELLTARAAGKLGIAGRLAMWLIVISVVIPTLYWFVAFDGAQSIGGMVFAVDFLACGALLLVAARAASSISGEKEKDTWVTLLSTPLTAREIVVGKLIGALHTARGLLIPVGFLWLLQALKKPGMLVAIPFTAVTLLIVAFFAASLGTNYSLHCRNSTRAMGATLATIVFVSGGYLFCCVPVMLGPGNAEIMFAPCVPFLLACISILVLEPYTAPDFSATIVFAYLSGSAGYLVAAFVLFETMVGRFDEANGRIGQK